jgi:hypothetical protein
VYSFNLIHFTVLLGLHLLYFQKLFTFFENVFSHFHSLGKVVISVLKNLLESLLVELDHLLLVNKHLTLRVLVGLSRELHVRHLWHTWHPRNLVTTNTSWHRWQLALESWWRDTHRRSHLHLRLLCLELLSYRMS